MADTSLANGSNYSESLSGIETDLCEPNHESSHVLITLNPYQGLKLWYSFGTRTNLGSNYSESLSGIETVTKLLAERAKYGSNYSESLSGIETLSVNSLIGTVSVLITLNPYQGLKLWINYPLKPFLPRYRGSNYSESLSGIETASGAGSSGMGAGSNYSESLSGIETPTQSALARQ